MKLPVISLFIAASITSFSVSESPALAADKSAGKSFFKICSACHSLEINMHKVGPSLARLFGRHAGTVSGFQRYSPHMKKAGNKGLIWSEELLLQYLANPKQFLRDFLSDPSARTSMTFAGIRKKKDLENLLAYLLEATR